eukprot:jgi/Hompol1/5978/HPOL_002134-RA
MAAASVGSKTIVSAPGKVLLTGGYLVLERRFAGLVVAMDARFQVHVEPATFASASVAVRSPQFTDGAWDYSIGFSHNAADATNRPVPVVHRTPDSPKNPFVETALRFTMFVLARLLARRNLPLNADSLRRLPTHNSTHNTIANVNKTGLGSSAAMTTSLVAALLAHFSVISIPALHTETHLAQQQTAIVYNLAQLCHCVAQGKVGSGFDVSAAVLGSHAYRRFSPTLLDPVFKATTEYSDDLMLAKVVADLVIDTKWDWETTRFKLPSKLQLVLGDVAAGSNTPKLVSKVLAWRSASPETSNTFWIELDQLNQRVRHLFSHLLEQEHAERDVYHRVVEKLAKLTASEWKHLDVVDSERSVVASFSDIFETFERVRARLRQMSELTGAPIEPVEQARLLDACLKVPGVLMGGVPGAGGYDAIFCIVLSDDARKNLHGLWGTWSETQVVPLLNSEATAGLIQL